MKKNLIVLLSICFVLAFAACKNSNATKSSEKDAQTELVAGSEKSQCVNDCTSSPKGSTCEKDCANCPKSGTCEKDCANCPKDSTCVNCPKDGTSVKDCPKEGSCSKGEHSGDKKQGAGKCCK